MGLFGGKDDTKSKIEELRAKMQQQQGGQAPAPQGQNFQPPAQPWQQQQQQPQYQAPQQSWQPPHEEHEPQDHSFTYEEAGSMDKIVLDLGDGMSLNLPVKGRMRLDEFLRIADRVRELKKIEHPQRY